MNQKKTILYIGNQLALHDVPPTTADILPAKLRELNFNVKVASNKRNKFFRLGDMLWLVFKNRNKTDVVLIDTYSTLNFYYAVCVASLCRFYAIPYVPILHGGNLPERLKKSKKLSATLFKKSRANISPSAYLTEQFKIQGFSNIIHIPNFLEINNYPFLEREKVDYKLLWVRSFDAIYNPKLALGAVEILLKKGKKVNLVMVGPDKDGSLEACKKIVENQNLPVKFTGLLSKEKWISLSKESDIFINTTHFDNMPVSVMEAMALGLPIVSTSVGGIPFLIENDVTGILTKQNDADDFADAIIKTVENSSDTLKRTREARKKMEELDWIQVEKKWISFLVNI